MSPANDEQKTPSLIGDDNSPKRIPAREAYLKKMYNVLHTLPIRVCAAQRGRDFEATDLERGSISEAFSRTGYNISNARKLQFCKQPFEIIQGQIAFKNTVQCVNKQTVVLFAP